MNETVELMFDGVLKICTRKEDRNNEVLYEAEDGSFVKFPDDENLEANIVSYNEANKDEVEIIPDVVYGEVTVFDKFGNEVK